MKEFIDESSPKDIFQAKLNSMMEKSNSVIQWELKGTLRRILVADKRDEKHYMQKNPQQIAILMGYEYALLERQRNRPT